MGYFLSLRAAPTRALSFAEHIVMQCPKCQGEIPPQEVSATPLCPHCGADLHAARPGTSALKRVGLISVVLLLIIFAASSTVVAMKTMRQRTAAEQALALSKQDF